MGVNLRPKEPRCRWVQYHTELSATGLVDSMLCLPGPLINLIPSINPKNNDQEKILAKRWKTKTLEEEFS
ncbi:hypothetical protein NC653_025202 [Populus alba x Populus x berolinensis]|uniref:Uncharacterized protein n=1 Tax=Populus alba x Populus x berolinensis TaxID=444605 RepID=A0AAD6MAM2_9ROSI|nr:hypothetical protein NC653_025202 [Populus alba x Populus x berolinensis]